MKALLTKKLMIQASLLLSLATAYGVYRDLKVRTVKTRETEINDEKVEDNPELERGVASDSVAKIAKQYVALNTENNLLVNGKWEIIRLIGQDGKAVFDKNTGFSEIKKPSDINLQLMENSTVRVDNKMEDVYHISLLSNFGTIVFFKKINDGYEIIEAKKIIENNKPVVVSGQVELKLERALNQSKSPEVLEGENVSGSVLLNEKQISNFDIQVTNKNGEVQSLDFESAVILDAGAFKVEINGEEVSGVVFNNGKDGYRISFVTGPMAGAMLNFVSDEQMKKLDEEKYENELKNSEQEEISKIVENDENAQGDEIKKATEIVLEERREIANDEDNYEPVRVLSSEEIKETAEVNGFAF